MILHAIFQFVFESEKQASTSAKLLNEIRSGVKLRKVKVNDRSKPMLEGKLNCDVVLEKYLYGSYLERKIVLNLSMHI